MKSNSVVLTLELMIVDSKGVLLLLFYIFVAQENKQRFQIPHFHANVAYRVI